MRALLAVLSLLLCGCFSPDTPVCVFSCAQAPHECPSGYECKSDMYCHKASTSGLCPGFALSDGGVDAPMTDAPLNDGPMTDAPELDAPEID